MNRRFLRSMRVVATSAMLVGATACDGIVEVVERDVIPPDQLNTAAGAAALYAGALRDFGAAIDGDNGGTEGQILVSGQMADEWFNGDTFNTRQDYDQRATDLNNGTLAGVFRVLQNARLSSKRALTAIENTSTDLANDARTGAMKNRIGAVFLTAAMNYCSGVPFSEVVSGQIEYGQPQTTAQMLAESITWFDQAIAGPAGTSSVNHNTARLLKARALMLQGPTQYAAAAALVATVPTNFRAVSEHSIANGGNENGVYVFNHLSRRWSLSHQEGVNGLPFRGAGDGTNVATADPRIVWVRDGIAFDNVSPLYRWNGSGGRDQPLPFAKGEEARLIEAEALLAAGDVPGWLGKLNALRTTVTGLAPLVDPGTAAARVNLTFSERGFWLFSTGTRLSDLRRLVKHYGRGAETVFPTGAYRKGGNYGTDLNVPVPTVENQNPNFTACQDRNA